MTEQTSSSLPPRVKDVRGKRFGRLIAVDFVRWHYFPNSKRKPVWRCVCDCGKTVEVLSLNLFSGHTKSCGCLGDENRAERVRLNTTHGGSKDYLYTVWLGMKQRCEDPNYKWFSRWGGRGIKVEWKSYEDFRRDMLPSYKPGLEIERIDNNGPYSKENCRWATNREQALNRRSNRIVTFKGESLPLKIWTDRLGLDYGSVRARLELGWSVEDALSNSIGRVLEFNGESKRLHEWAEAVGIPIGTLWARLKAGWSIEKTLTTAVRQH